MCRLSECGKRLLVSGFVLADEGYDVWIGNTRGNTYGMAHVNMSTNSKGFWDFS